MDKIEQIADKLTNLVMERIYGDRFINTDDITEDFEMSASWDYWNDVFYDALEKSSSYN